MSTGSIRKKRGGLCISLVEEEASYGTCDSYGCTASTYSVILHKKKEKKPVVPLWSTVVCSTTVDHNQFVLITRAFYKECPCQSNDIDIDVFNSKEDAMNKIPKEDENICKIVEIYSYEYLQNILGIKKEVPLTFIEGDIYTD